MSADDATMSYQPAPARDRGTALSLAFGLLAGPAAWFGQLCAGYALTSWPCFPGDHRLPSPVAGFDWTWAATGAVSLVAFIIALSALGVSMRLLLRNKDEHGDLYLLEVGPRRTRFLAWWGVVAGGVFALAIAFTAVWFFILPRCAG